MEDETQEMEEEIVEEEIETEAEEVSTDVPSYEQVGKDFEKRMSQI